jgi:hypothetical protein
MDGRSGRRDARVRKTDGRQQQSDVQHAEE